jgi:rare lipoprotein A
LSGKHAVSRTSSRFRRLIPLIGALTTAGLLVAGAVAAMNLGPARNASVQAAASTPQSVYISQVPGVAPSRSSTERASRGELRVVPSSSPSPSPSKTKAESESQPSGAGIVTSTGSCQASFYDTGVTTANGERFDPNAYTAAHKTLPFNTRVRVTNKSNGKSVVVRINDRGPFVAGRCLDLTTAAFSAIANPSSGVVSVTYQVLS